VKEIPQPKNLEAAQEVIATLSQALHYTQLENEKLKHELARLLRQSFGSKSEKIDPRQLFLLLEGLGIPAEQPIEDDACEIPRRLKTRKGGRGRRPLPKSLPREHIVVDIPEPEKICECGCRKVQIGSVVSEKLDYVPASFKVLEQERLRYACPSCHEGVVTAEAPAQAVEKGLAAEGLLAQVVVSKYGDHLPLHRQSRIYSRHGIDLPRSTLCDFVEQVATALAPIREELKRQILSRDYLQTDDTPVSVLAETKGTFKGRIWTYLDPLEKQVVFDATPTHERDGPDDFLESFQGYLQADAYAGYDALYKQPHRGIVEVACWAHARRRFVEALPTDARAAPMVKRIQELYEVEREGKDLDFEARKQLRERRSIPILAEIEQERETLEAVVLPKSPLGDAVRYMKNQWHALQRFTEDGRLRIDNNGAEYQLRAVGIGRKNWLFAGSMEGAHRAAVLYSLVQSCQLVGIDPFVYFRDVLLRVATHPQSRIAELTPAGWARIFGPDSVQSAS
jgi:transposase